MIETPNDIQINKNTTKSISKLSKLNEKWRIWEGISKKFQNGKAYKDCLIMVYPIETMGDLGNLFKKTSYGFPSRFFFSPKERQIKQFIPDGYSLENITTTNTQVNNYDLVKRSSGKLC